MNTDQSKEENSDGTERQKEVSFRILEIKRNHYDRKDLISIAMKVDDKEYEISFLLDNFHVTFFPEFKDVDKYGGKGGFKIIHNFLQSINSKTKYFSEIHINESQQTGIQTYEREWWMERKGQVSESDELFNEWVKRNNDYLIQNDFSEFDNERIDEVVKYLEVRKEFVKPAFINVRLESSEIVSLEKRLKKALELEDYEEAIKIREEIKKTK